MKLARSRWLLVLASLLFLIGSISFLDDDHYTLGAWMFVLGSALFLTHSLADALAGRGDG